MLVTCSPSCNQATDALHHPLHASRSAGYDRGTVPRVSTQQRARKQALEEGWVLPFFIVTKIGIHELMINRPLQYVFMSYRMDKN